MELATYCSFAFCTTVLTNIEFGNYNSEMQLEDLGYKADVNYQDAKYLLDVTDHNMKLKLEEEIRKALVTPGYAAVGKLHNMSVTAIEQQKDSSGSCYFDNKKQLLDAVRTAFYQLEPCVAYLEYEYVSLSSKAQAAKANAENLVSEVERLRTTCSVATDNTQQQCYDTGYNELLELIKNSGENHQELYTLYHNTIGHVPGTVDCVHQASVELEQKLNSILQVASNCYAQKGVV